MDIVSYTSEVQIYIYIYIYIYMELLAKPEVLTSYIYGPTLGNAESCLFIFAAQCFNTESMKKSFPVSQLCVNILPATKVTLITDGI
jgi:hypothetical protein